MTTIGQKLKESREEKRLTLEKIFEATRIRVQYLQALEADDLSIMPSPVQARGYLRNYAEFLELNVEKLLDELREVNAQKPSEIVYGPADTPDGRETETPERSFADEAAPVENTTSLVKPKPARRKKAELQPEGDSITPPKRRARKKVESEPEIIVSIEPATNVTFEASDSKGFQPPADESHPLQTALPDNTEQGSETASSRTNSESTVKPAIEEIPQAPVELTQSEEMQPIPDVSDNLWQSWLGRLTSV